MGKVSTVAIDPHKVSVDTCSVNKSCVDEPSTREHCIADDAIVEGTVFKETEIKERVNDLSAREITIAESREGEVRAFDTSMGGDVLKFPSIKIKVLNSIMSRQIL